MNCINLEKLTDTLAPGQGEQLIQMAQAHSHTKDDQASQQAMNNEMIQNLKRIYDLYVKQKMPFDEQVRLLSLLPRSWQYDKIMNIFGCSRQAIAAAHRMRDDKEYLLNREEEPSVRQRADPVKIKHFVSWLVESNTLVSGRD